MSVLEVLYYENFDIESVVTPVNVDEYERLLIASDYDRGKTEMLIKGFRTGFDIGYRGSETVKLTAPNLPFTIGDEVDLWNKVMKEVKLKRFAGPFKKIPYESFIQSPIGLVPKDDGKDMRLIFHLSYPRIPKAKGDHEQNKFIQKSVNANTPKEFCTVHYPEFAEAVRRCMAAGINCSTAKSDMKSAFRNLGVLPQQFKYLLMKARSPIDGKWYYFLDKCLPFGAGISCKLFQEFSNSIAHLVKWRLQLQKAPINYLDDFFFVAFLKYLCDQQLQGFIDICEAIKFPIAMDKTYWGSTEIVFLGFLLNTAKQIIGIPRHKIVRGINMITYLLDKRSRKATVHEMQELCGFLNFLGKAIVPGRAFTRRLYAFAKGKTNLKPFHHVKITPEMRSDMNTWLQFLHNPAAYYRPFADFSITRKAIDIDFYTDASKNPKLGFGGKCGNSYFFQKWDANVIHKIDPSIGYLELYSAVTGILLWGKNFKNSRIQIYCDNQSACFMINDTTSNCKNCMVLIRILVSYCLVHNLRVFAEYVETSKNIIADSLSRLQFRRFHRHAPLTMDKYPTAIPDDLWPMTKAWMY